MPFMTRGDESRKEVSVLTQSLARTTRGMCKQCMRPDDSTSNEEDGENYQHARTQQGFDGLSKIRLSSGETIC